MSALALQYRSYGERGPALVILHGLFGSARNWHSLAQQLAATHRVFALDLRNHGDSPHSPAMDYPSMAADVVKFVRARGLDDTIVLGHSMGGKVAMQIALAHALALRALIVVDIAPRSYPRHHDDVLEAMRSVDFANMRSRHDVDAALQARIPDSGLRQFILTNVARTPQGLGWRVNLSAIVAHYESLAAAPRHAQSFEGPSLFVAGERSAYVSATDRGRIGELFPASRIVTIAGAGHWPHAERPQQFAAAIMTFLEDL